MSWAERHRTAGCDVDTSGADWMQAGEFEIPPEPGKGLPLGKRIPASTAGQRNVIDLRYHDRDRRRGRLEIINRGPAPVYNLNIELPPEAGTFRVHDSELPLPELPSGKNIMFLARRAFESGESYFKVRVTHENADWLEKSS